jgi:dTDP-4-amino-4,6-dideoxygalactose transaminase
MGAFADLVCFSTTSTKQIGGIGNGGMVATADETLRQRLELYRSYGLSPARKASPQAGGEQEVDGLNLMMSPVNAAVVTLKMAHLPAWTERRREIARQYETRLRDGTGITLASFRPESEPVRREFALRVRGRDAVLAALRKQGIQAAMNYFPPAHLRNVYRDEKLRGSEALARSEEISRELLTLPVDPLLTDEDIDYVCDCLLEALQG